MRLIDCPALIVWIVVSTRWPVSAAVSAISTVARSRISPTRMTFGAWRSAERRPLGKSSKSLPEFALVEGRALVLVHEFDRVLERHHVHRLRLVDLVEHRGERRRLAAAGRAGDEDQPVFLPAHLSKDRRAARATASEGISLCVLRMTIAKLPRCLKIFTRKRAPLVELRSCNRTRRAAAARAADAVDRRR